MLARSGLGRTAGPCLGGKNIFVLAKPAVQGSGRCQATALVIYRSYSPAAPRGFELPLQGVRCRKGPREQGNLLFLPSLDLYEGKHRLSWSPWDPPHQLVAPLGSFLPSTSSQPALGAQWLVLPADIFGCSVSSKLMPKLRCFKCEFTSKC